MNTTTEISDVIYVLRNTRFEILLEDRKDILSLIEKMPKMPKAFLSREENKFLSNLVTVLKISDAFLQKP